eukprot:jgi/Botrbrau1/14023/Bobra.0310s0010.1
MAVAVAILLFTSVNVVASRLLSQGSSVASNAQGSTGNVYQLNLPAADCGSSNANYSYAVYAHKDTCAEPHNAACPSCDLWSFYEATPAAQQSCKREVPVTGHWCDRLDSLTLVQVQQDHYLALPNQPVTGVENWYTLDGAEKFWGSVWAGAEWVHKEKAPAWTLDDLGIALNPSASREQHQMQMHFHYLALKPTWQSSFDSRRSPSDPGKPWPSNQWVPMEGGTVQAKFLPSTAPTPAQINPFVEWARGNSIVKITKGYPVHEVGLLVTRDAAGKSWFIALADGAAEIIFFDDFSIIFLD